MIQASNAATSFAFAPPAQTRRRGCTAALALTLVALAACDQQPLTWREELKLFDGRTIVATKTERYQSGVLGTATSRPALVATNVQFNDPDDPRKVYTHSIEGDSGYLMIDFDAGVPWIVGRAGPGHKPDEGCGDKVYASYVTFRWDGTRFERVPHAALPEKFTKPNTVPVSWDPQILETKHPLSHYRIAGELAALCASTPRSCELARAPVSEAARGCLGVSASGGRE